MTIVPNESDLIEPGLPSLGREIEFLRLIWDVDHALHRRSNVMARSLGVTGPQRLVIRIVGRFPSVNAGQLAEILHLHPSSLTALLKRLASRGLVRRRADARDRRRLILGLTPRGLALNVESPGTIEAAVKHMLAEVSSRDLEGAQVVLATLARTLNAQPPPTRPQRKGATKLAD